MLSALNNVQAKREELQAFVGRSEAAPCRSLWSDSARQSPVTEQARIPGNGDFRTSGGHHGSPPRWFPVLAFLARGRYFFVVKWCAV